MRVTEKDGGWILVRPPVTPKAAPSETEEQCGVVSWCHAAGIRVHHSPNGQRISIGQASKFQAMGVSPGFPDLVFPKIRCAIEMKRANGGSVSAEQAEWLELFAALGWTSAACHGMEAALWVLRKARG